MVEQTVSQERSDFYVYVIFRPNGSPCYVGKGRGRRWKTHATGSHNIRLARIYAKADGFLPVVKVRDNLASKDACEIEIAFIRAIGRGKSGPLVNMTDGGEGLLGKPQSPGHYAKLAAKYKGRKRPEHVRQALILAANNRSEEYRTKMSASQRGKTITPEAKLKMSIAQLARRGKTLADVIPKRPPLSREERSERQRLRNVGNKYGIGNKRTAAGEAIVAASTAESNRRRNKSGNPTVWKDRTAPWVELGLSRTTWFRRRAEARTVP